MLHVGDPANADRLRPSVEVGAGQLTGPAEQSAVTGAGAGGRQFGLSASDPLDHLGDQTLFLGFADASGHQNDDSVALSIGGHGAAACASPNLDRRCWINHAVTLSCRGDNDRWAGPAVDK